ncbi:MAG: 2-dehydropantoate 2-reductase, partial [Acetobacteraceae bacterium]|nr:2-dehydropantoate 2-reductase [Acetobacteraceae bacterium]
ISVRAALDTASVGTVDVVLIVTKSTDTRAAAESSRALIGASTLVLSLQNGLGNLEAIAEVVGAERSLLGMTYVGATVVAPARVRLTAPGVTFVGVPTAGTPAPRVVSLARTLSDAGLPTESTDRVWPMIWGKLVINAALNATCALTGANGTTALECAAISHWLGLVADETAAVAAAAGIELPYADAAERVRRHCLAVGASKPSMLQDIERGRPTEIEAINGAVVREGQRLGVPTPCNQALLLLVKGRQEVARGAAVLA